MPLSSSTDNLTEEETAALIRLSGLESYWLDRWGLVVVEKNALTAEREARERAEQEANEWLRVYSADAAGAVAVDLKEAHAQNTALKARLSGLPDAFKAAFVGYGELTPNRVLRWLEEQAGKEKG